MLDHFDIAKYFTYVSASDLSRTYDTKQRIIENALAACNVGDYSQAVMIGDRKYDIIAAKALGISSIGVLYGYGDRRELVAAGVDCIVQDVQELYNVIAQ
jgi:phosphoglycolate phosphatase